MLQTSTGEMFLVNFDGLYCITLLNNWSGYITTPANPSLYPSIRYYSYLSGFQGEQHYFLQLDTDVGEVQDDVVPSEFQMSQNYPNPFNQSTQINYYIPSDERVSVKIFNIHGIEVVTLLDDYSSAGWYSIRWDGRNHPGIKMPSGIYICQVQVGQLSQVQKMTLGR